MNKFIAFIPIRGGSKSIPLKNIKEIAGQPLVYWAIDAAVNCKYIQKVYISTDSDEITKVITSYSKRNSHKLVCVKRSPQTATDEAPTESAMLEFASNYKFNNILLIQATSPLLSTNDLNVAIEKYINNDYDSLLSVVKQKRFIWEIDHNNTFKPQNYNLGRRPRRQEQEGFFVENGAFYITKRDQLLKTGLRISGEIGFYEMSDETYFEIDEESDWIIVESLLKNKVSTFLERDYSNIKLFAMDCDGVLTDAGMYYTEQGDEIKKFNTKDGMGIGLLHREGIKTAIITGENSIIVDNRATKLQIDDVFLGVKDKVSIMEKLIKRYDLTYDEVAFVGDDINDLELLKKVKYSFSVNDAMDEVKRHVDYVTSVNGGQGAVREIVELILESRNKV